jgi:hypothetical protein
MTTRFVYRLLIKEYLMSRYRLHWLTLAPPVASERIDLPEGHEQRLPDS